MLDMGYYALGKLMSGVAYIPYRVFGYDTMFSFDPFFFFGVITFFYFAFCSIGFLKTVFFEK
jgi:hypothetical protein